MFYVIAKKEFDDLHHIRAELAFPGDPIMCNSFFIFFVLIIN
jgi:hypothetical protein